MHITIIAVGKLREKYWQQAVEEYLKRLQRYATVQVIEIAEEQAPETLSAAERAQVKIREGERIRKALRDGQHVFALTLDGKSFTSEGFADHLQHLALTGHSDLAFLIGGSLGLDPDTQSRAHTPLTLGPLTYPHQMVRVMLLEQIYRAFKIMRGEPYHK